MLYVSRRPRVRIDPIMSGGGQERGMRSGTVPHTLVVGMGAACAVASKEMEVGHDLVTTGDCIGDMCRYRHSYNMYMVRVMVMIVMVMVTVRVVIVEGDGKLLMVLTTGDDVSVHDNGNHSDSVSVTMVTTVMVVVPCSMMLSG